MIKKPNGTPRKKLDINLAKNYGWKSKLVFLKVLILYLMILKKKEFEMKNLIIVTGVCGFIGTNLINLLLTKTKDKIISIDDYW